MPAPKRRKQRVAIALEQRKQLETQTEENKKAQAIELLKQNQKKAQEAMAKAEVIKPTQKKQRQQNQARKKGEPNDY